MGYISFVECIHTFFGWKIFNNTVNVVKVIVKNLFKFKICVPFGHF